MCIEKQELLKQLEYLNISKYVEETEFIITYVLKENSGLICFSDDVFLTHRK